MLIKAVSPQKIPIGKSKETNVLRINFNEVEQEFTDLIKTQNLDQQIGENSFLVEIFENAIEEALIDAYHGKNGSDEAHLFIQRILYQINRMKLFWYDDLKNYHNENSSYLASLRFRIENIWQRWEIRHLSSDSLKSLDVERSLHKRVAADLYPQPTEEGLYFRNQMTRSGYQRLLAIASLDGLVEASQLSRVIGGVGNKVQATLTRLLLEEYGGGRLARKHSTFFASMLKEFGMQTKPEAYLSIVPWEVLANINNSFIFSDRKRYFLRYVGGLLYNEVSVPAAFDHYKTAAERLGLSKDAKGYWELHIKEDERHGRWMLQDVAIPLIKPYKDFAWELILGYDQQKFLSSRASTAIKKSVSKLEKK